MPLEPGTNLGPYTVTAQIAAGGMGEVYQARDTKLDRDVALKVLPEAFTSDPDRLARFEREAKVLASLNHPNIGHIYGLEEAEGTKALVLELVEGPTLADRIKQGPIPVDEALPIAKQIAEALEAAHEQGIIHRDLKPANVKVKADGTVKVLDFGLAKAFQWEETVRLLRIRRSSRTSCDARATRRDVSNSDATRARRRVVQTMSTGTPECRPPTVVDRVIRRPIRASRRVATRRTRVVRRPTYVRGNVSAPSKHDAERDVARHSLLSNRDDVAGVVRRLIARCSADQDGRRASSRRS